MTDQSHTMNPSSPPDDPIFGAVARYDEAVAASCACYEAEEPDRHRQFEAQFHAAQQTARGERPTSSKARALQGDIEPIDIALPCPIAQRIEQRAAEPDKDAVRVTIKSMSMDG